jgi:hypothetical protein
LRGITVSKTLSLKKPRTSLATSSDRLFRREARVQGAADALDGAGDLADALEGEEFRLQRHDHAIGGHQRVQRDEAEGGWAIEEDEVEAGERFGPRLQGERQPALPFVEADKLDLGAGEIGVGGQDREVGDGGRADHLGQRPVLDQQGVGARSPVAAPDAEAGGGVALGVEIHQQHLVLRGKRGGQVDRGGGLADAALLVGEGEDPRVGAVSQPGHRGGSH